MIKTVIAYGQLLLGFPILVAYLVWYSPNFIIEKIWETKDISEYYYMVKNIIEGVVSILFAYFIFEWLQIEITLWIPLILLGVSSLWKLSQNEAFMILFINSGIFIGYKLFPYIHTSTNQW
jgi:hypothetical protein